MSRAIEGKSQVAAWIDRSPLGAIQWTVVVLCGAVAVLDGFDVQAVAFVAPDISRLWSLPRDSLGLLLSAGMVGMLIGAISQGPLADRFGRKPVILASVTLFGVVSLFMARAASFQELLILRLLGGLGMGAAIPSVITLTGEFAPARMRAMMVVIMNAGFPLGGFLGGLLSSHLIQNSGWRAVFVAGGTAPLILLPLLAWLLPESIVFRVERSLQRGVPVEPRALDLLRRIARNDEPVEFPVRQVSASPSQNTNTGPLALFADGRAVGTLMLWLAFFSSQIVYFILVSWLPSLLVDAGIPAHKAVIGSALLNLGSVVGGLALAWISRRVQAHRLLVANFLVGACLCVVARQTIGQPITVVYLVAAMLGFCSGGGQLMLNAVGASFYPTLIRATGLGGAWMAGRFGSILGPEMGGLLMSIGLAAPDLLAFVAVPATLAAVGAGGVGSRKRDPEGSEQSLPASAPRH